MKGGSLTSFFEEYLHSESVFTNKKALLPSFMPETVFHRDEEIKHIAAILAPAMKFDKPSNIFLYGNTGTGKTLSIKHITQNMETIAAERTIPLKIIYLNCKLKRVADTEYRLMAQLASYFGKTLPSTGLPTDEVYKVFYKAVDTQKTMVLLVLDEIDQLIKKTGDNILYNLTRINEELQHSLISIVGVSNDTTFIEHIDNRVKSSLSEEDVFFKPYNALQMQSILRDRAEKAFKTDCVQPGVIEKCAAYATHEHGDARRALDLLRVSGELAERHNQTTITIDHIDQAEQKLEKERIFDIIKTQPKQFQAVLYAIISIKEDNKDIHTGEMYELYKKLCFRVGLRPLTQRRISDILGEFDLLGIVNCKTISKGRYGRTREIHLSIPPSTYPMAKKILEEELTLD